MVKLKKTIFLSILVSIGLALSIIESTIPLPIIIPGARLGLSNMVVLITLVMFGLNEGMAVSGLKSIVLMLVTGSISSLIYSFAGSIISCLVMYIIYKYFSKTFSLIGVSIFGALTHNFVQVSIASIMLKNMRIYTYLPFLMLTSIFTGYFVGLASIYIIKNLRKNFNILLKK